MTEAEHLAAEWAVSHYERCVKWAVGDKQSQADIFQKTLQLFGVGQIPHHEAIKKLRKRLEECCDACAGKFSTRRFLISNISIKMCDKCISIWRNVANPQSMKLLQEWIRLMRRENGIDE